jgi:hypothetical protein
MRSTLLEFVGWAALYCTMGSTVACGAKKREPEPAADDSTIPQVPVPAANAVKLLAVQHGVVVRDRPSPNGKVLGTLRAGARVSRANEPYSKRNCAGGWYPIRPRGFVCAGEEATLDMDHPVAKVLAERPAVEKALPYRFGRVKKGEAVLYGKLPSYEEQLSAEPKLASRGEKEPRTLGTGANDVPLNGAFLPTGVAVLNPDGEGVGPDGKRTTQSLFVFPGPQTAPAGVAVGGKLTTLDNRVLKQGSGVALVASFLTGEGKAERRFGVTQDGRFVPTDRLGEALGTTWHGFDLSNAALPVAFAIRSPHTWSLEKGEHPEMLDDELEPYQAIPLTGRFRTVDNTLFYATTDNKWIRHKDAIMLLPRHKFPDFAVAGQKWIEISLANQTLVAWDGRKPVYATLISSGQDRLGDPAAGAPATLQGQFRIRSKWLSRPIDDAEVRGEFSLSDVPWALDFADGFSITGSYWQKNFGEPGNFHNVTLAPIDAHWLWHWTEIELPEGWHSVTLPDDAASPIVFVHK